MEEKKFESQTELERDLRLQLAQKDLQIAASETRLMQWEGLYHHAEARARILQTEADVLRDEINKLKTINETQSSLLGHYQKHVELSLKANEIKLMLPEPSHE